MISIKKQEPFILLNKYDLSPSAFILRFTRNDLQFKAGQTLSVGVWGQAERREYSIYSGEKDDFLEILIKIVENGKVTPALKKLKPGHRLNVHGPGGFFVPNPHDIATKHHLFIATGTGISPFHSILRSHSGIRFTLLHGIRTMAEAYGRDTVPPAQYVTCVSRQNAGVFQGRVTDYLQQIKASPDTQCYLCGNCQMIYDAYDILKHHGFTANQILTEVYF